MKAPWWHRAILTLFTSGIVGAGLWLNFRSHFGVMITFTALVYGVLILMSAIYQPQLTRLSPIFTLDMPPDKITRYRTVMIRVGIVLILAGLYGVYALLTGIGAPYD